MAMASVRAARWNVIWGLSMVCALFGVTVFIVLVPADITPPTSPTALDPNTAISKKELIFKFLPRTKYESEKVAIGTGQFNIPSPGGTEVQKFTWAMSIDGDGRITVSLDQKLPPTLLKFINGLAPENIPWHAGNSIAIPRESISSGYISAPNTWLHRDLHESISIQKLVTKYLVELRGNGLWMETTKYSALPPSDMSLKHATNPASP